MKFTEKIHKLLCSNTLEDVALGIQFMYLEIPNYVEYFPHINVGQFGTNYCTYVKIPRTGNEGQIEILGMIRKNNDVYWVNTTEILLNTLGQRWDKEYPQLKLIELT